VKDKQWTVKWVVKHKLCTGCGICTAVCLHNALDMTTDESRGCFVPELRQENCQHCGLCYQVCPGHGVDFDGLSRELFGDIPSEIALGRHLATYVGHATDQNIRYDSTSGGVVTALLIFALEHDLIDGALVTRMRRDNPLVPEPFIARTRKEILSAAGSKYCPVTIGAALREVLDSKGRFAVVGLPCHIQGIRKAEHEIVELSGRIRYRISLVCSLNYSFHGTRRLIESLGIPPQEVQELQYRGRGWPGTMQLRTKDGTETVVPLGQYYRKLGPYSLWRCLLCSDTLGELSDLSCGDAWLPDLVKTDKAGSSFVISRTPEAEELLEAAAAREAVELSELGIQSLLASQGRALFKKRKLKARMRLARLLGRRMPKYRQTLMTPTLSDYVNTIKLFVARRAFSGKHPVLRRLFNASRRWKRRKRTEHVQRETVVQASR
jgi:coenzyme F420 hydrogenase subunit beta